MITVVIFIAVFILFAIVEYRSEDNVSILEACFMVLMWIIILGNAITIAILLYDGLVHNLVGSRDYMILGEAQMITKYIVEPDKVLFVVLNNFYAPI